MWGVCSVLMYFFLLCIVLHRSLFYVWCGIFFITCFHDSWLTWRGIIYVMYLLSWFFMLCFEIPLLYVAGILMLSSCMFCIEIPFMPSWQDAHHTWVCVILIGVFCLRVPVVEHLLEPLLREGIFLVWYWHHLLCTSSLLTTLNVATYTILTPGPRDVFPLGQTPLSMSCVFLCWWLLCSFFFTTWIYVPLCYFNCNYNHIKKEKDLS